MQVPKKRHFQSYSQLMHGGLQLAAQNWLPAIYLMLLPVALRYVVQVSFVNTSLQSPAWYAGQTLGIVVIVFALANNLAFLYYLLRQQHGYEPTLSETYRRSLPLLFKYVAINIIFAVAVVIGFIAFIVPGFIILQRLFFASSYLADKRVGIREALTLSWSAGGEQPRAIWMFFLACYLVVLVTVLPSLYLPNELVASIIAQCAGIVVLCMGAIRFKELCLSRAEWTSDGKS